MSEPKIKVIPGTTKMEEIEESFGSYEDTTALLSAIRGWKDPNSSDTLLNHEASLCKSLDGIAQALLAIARAIEGRD